jgi:hypothetical protein
MRTIAFPTTQHVAAIGMAPIRSPPSHAEANLKKEGKLQTCRPAARAAAAYGVFHFFLAASRFEATRPSELPKTLPA